MIGFILQHKINTLTDKIKAFCRMHILYTKNYTLIDCRNKSRHQALQKRNVKQLQCLCFSSFLLSAFSRDFHFARYGHIRRQILYEYLPVSLKPANTSTYLYMYILYFLSSVIHKIINTSSIKNRVPKPNGQYY